MWETITAAYLQGKSTLEYPPVHIFIEPTNYCNLRCIMCPQHELMTRKRGYIDFELFKKIVVDCKNIGVEYINLFFLGESFLHPKIFDMITYAKLNSVGVNINTNGTLLNKNIARQILKSGIDTLSISFDGIEQSIYENIRRNASFTKTLKNIKYLLQLKYNGAYKTKIFMEIIKIPETIYSQKDEKTEGRKNKNFGWVINQDIIEKYKNELQTLEGLDEVKIKKFRNWAGAFKTNITEKEKTKKQKDYKTVRLKNYKTICSYPWRSMSVLWDGKCVPCCVDYDGKYIIGDINYENLQNIWNSETMASLRLKLTNKSERDIIICKNCDIPYMAEEHPKNSEQ